MTAATTTAAQNTFWRKLRAHVDGLPKHFTPGKYRCPAHDDKGRSLKVDYRDNAVRVHCFSSNCSGQAVMDRIEVSRKVTDIHDKKNGAFTFIVVDTDFRRAGKPVIVDPKGTDFTRYRGATLLTPNRREIAEATQMPVDNDAGVESAASDAR